MTLSSNSSTMLLSKSHGEKNQRSFQIATQGKSKLWRLLHEMIADNRVLAFLSLLVATQVCTSVNAADKYELRIPGNDTVTSTAVVDEGKLTLFDKRGRSFDYLRAAEMDNDDASYRAYWSDKAGQYLRWPVSNSGNLQIGKRSGRSVAWRTSQMAVFATGETEPTEVVSNEASTQLAHRISTLRSPDKNEYAAQIDRSGALQMFQYADNRWRHAPKLSGETLGLESSVALAWNKNRSQPAIWSINDDGRLFTIDRGIRRVIHRDQNVRFDRGAPIAISQSGQPAAMIVDRKGRLWEVDLRTGDFHSIDARENVFPRNSQLAIANSVADELFAIDRKGNATAYTRKVGGWSAPNVVGRNFAPGGYLHAVPNAANDRLYLASVDASGAARVLSRNGGTWNKFSAPSHSFAPGRPIALRHNDRGLSLSGIDARGDWYAFNRGHDVGRHDVGGPRNRWERSLLGSGFDPRVPPCYRGGQALALDRSGRMIAASPFRRENRLALLSPRYQYAPYIRTRKVIENPPLPPARIVLTNTSAEELVVKIYNTRTDAKIKEIKIAARGNSTQTLERYSGVTVEETLLVDDGFGNVRGESERFGVPAPNIYHVVVWVNRVQSVYFDRTKNTGPIPDSESKSVVSLGVFPLPAGPDLTDGINIDLVRIAKEQKNPGAAGVFKR